MLGTSRQKRVLPIRMPHRQSTTPGSKQHEVLLLFWEHVQRELHWCVRALRRAASERNAKLGWWSKYAYHYVDGNWNGASDVCYYDGGCHLLFLEKSSAETGRGVWTSHDPAARLQPGKIEAGWYYWWVCGIVNFVGKFHVVKPVSCLHKLFFEYLAYEVREL